MSGVRIVTAPLGGSPLSRLAQSGGAPVEWYPRRPQTPDEWRARADEIRGAISSNWFAALAPAFGLSSGAAADRLARVVEEKGVVVTTGQQPGLFGGPVYTWSKALSALALADTIERDTGVPAAPVFWAATDDSDFAEGAYTYIARPGGADRLDISSSMPDGTRVSDIPLSDVRDLIARLEAACGSAADPRPVEFTKRAYRAPATVGSAYISLLRSILEPLGIAVLDAAHAATTFAAHPSLVRALHERERVTRALADRSAAIIAAGFSPQVPDVPDLTLVFERKGLLRERIARAHAAVVVASAEPGSLSPNVLLRPVVERSLMPTVAYVAGPGEISYFAQVSAVANAVGLPLPLAVPRWSVTLIEPHVAELMARYDVQMGDFADPHAVEARLARAAWPAGVAKALDHLRRDLAERLAGLKASLQDLDGMAPAATVDGTGRALDWRISRLERRISASVKRREVSLMRDMGTIRGSLQPGGVRQERRLNMIPILARHGLGLLEDMRDHAAAHARTLVSGAREPAVAS